MNTFNLQQGSPPETASPQQYCLYPAKYYAKPAQPDDNIASYLYNIPPQPGPCRCSGNGTGDDEDGDRLSLK